MAKRHKIKEDLSSELRKKYGEGILTTADQLVVKEREILKTTLSLDYALGGGIPDGTVCLLSGKEKIGKTSLCLTILRNAIEQDRPVYYFNIERRCKKELLGTIKGLDPAKIQWVQSTPEHTLMAEEWLDILEKIIKDSPRAVIIVDSLAGLCTALEMSEDFGSKKDMAGTPKLLSSFFRRTQQPIDTQDVILFFITQRMTNRDMNGPKYSSKGGQAVKYFASAIIEMNWAKKWQAKEGESTNGHDIQVDVTCAPMGKPYIKCEVPLRFGEGIDTTKDVITRAIELAMIEKAGAWYEYKNEKYHGMDNLYEFFKTNPEELVVLENMIREIIFCGSETTQRPNDQGASQN